ncbi:hypothetical protein ACFYY5_29385 [Nocardia elegans]|uniref:Phage protein n=1 Tax=Nocardia elegans TaxID=300029 RepID=A0ABW6TLF6_9NOCA
MTPQKYKKRPVEIEAEHLSSLNGERITEWINANGGTARLGVIKWIYDRDTDTRKPYDGDNPLWIEIETLEGTMTANVGDWIIRGVAGEFYPCRSDVFAQTYEAVERSADYNITVADVEALHRAAKRAEILRGLSFD